MSPFFQLFLTSLLSFDWLAAVFITVLLSSVWITLIANFIQLRSIPLMFRLLVRGPRVSKNHSSHSNQAIDPRSALLTAMSTTIGIGNIFGPIVAIAFAGPGALLAYILATFLGAASTYTEVFFAMRFRHKYADGTIQAGPMAYMNHVLPPIFALIYATSGSLLLAAWSMTQSHTVSHMFAVHQIPCSVTGAALALIVVYAILNGIQWIAKLNDRLVPLMFLLYVGSGCAILAQHIDQFPATCRLILDSFWQPRSIIAGVSVYSFFDVLRWGLARALQSNEAGIGTSTIPHSLSESDSPSQQGILAMASVYSNGIICMISGLIFLMSGAYERLLLQGQEGFDPTVVNKIFSDHFTFGEPLILLITFLFAFGTILGNAYNGSRCFAYLTGNRWTQYYTLAAGLAVFIGSTLDLKQIWSLIDYLMVPVALSHTLALLILSYRYREVFKSP